MHEVKNSEKFTPVVWLLRIIIILVFVISLQVDPGGTTPLLVLFSYFLLDLTTVVIKPFKNFGYIVFLLMFNFFLLNSLLVSLFKEEGNLLEAFSLTTRTHVLVCLFTSLVAVDIGYAVKFKSLDVSRDSFTGGNSTDFRWNSVRKISWVLFCASGVLHLFSQLHKSLHVANNGYLSYYSSYAAPIPFIFGFAATAFTFSFALYLASKPSRRHVYKASIIYIGLQLLALGYGQRNPGMIAVLIVLFYLSIREVGSNRKGEWFPKRLVVGIMVALPFVLSFLYVVSYQRQGEEVQSGSVLEGSVALLEQQGGSIRVIAQGFEYRETLSQYGFYVFAPLIDAVTTNPIYRIFVEETNAPRSSESALNSGHFDLILTYIVSPITFASGGGLGSSYIAELYQDFGYIGVILGSVLFGIILSYTRTRSVFYHRVPLLLALMVLPAIWYSPRASFFTFFYDLANASVLLVLGIVLVHIGVAKRSRFSPLRIKSNRSRELANSSRGYPKIYN
ncbi:O-antigen polysaccharide polymerase Wzy family protein [Corynebacterium gallinarum]|uniref:O-antigen polysaccharide polymerase Wzy family protein n=1 Tax=Corynebacterium gallinarum TaxID=2762214 RepID=A0A8I0LHI1_9CORY|nr:O-antigen polysaccharide polymerase Wzy family protein [Corynebacterium gallinarum]MBD8031025.1 O-antigen polysaccharide polymerase Wzy family protein [Corynebacterium gallinarum]